MKKTIDITDIALARGYFIEVSIQLETLMTEVITYHFCGENDDIRKEFVAVILAKEGFRLSFKKEIFHHIITTHYLQEYNNRKLLSYDNIDRVNNIRNMYAHDISVLKNNNISFIKAGLTNKSKNTDTKRKPTVTFPKENIQHSPEHTKLVTDTYYELKDFVVNVLKLEE